MKLTCKECEGELSFTDLHEDGSELVITPCDTCQNQAYENGHSDGLEECPCTEDDYAEGERDGYAAAQDEVAELKARIAKLEAGDKD